MGPLNATDRMTVFVLYLTDVKKNGIFIEDRLFKWQSGSNIGAYTVLLTHYWTDCFNLNSCVKRVRERGCGGARHVVSASVALLKVIAGTTFIFNCVQAKLGVCAFESSV